MAAGLLACWRRWSTARLQELHRLTCHLTWSVGVRSLPCADSRTCVSLGDCCLAGLFSLGNSQPLPLWELDISFERFKTCVEDIFVLGDEDRGVLRLIVRVPYINTFTYFYLLHHWRHWQVWTVLRQYWYHFFSCRHCWPSGAIIGRCSYGFHWQASHTSSSGAYCPRSILSCSTQNWVGHRAY